jgi:hypothetical protein
MPEAEQDPPTFRDRLKIYRLGVRFYWHAIAHALEEWWLLAFGRREAGVRRKLAGLLWSLVPIVVTLSILWRVLGWDKMTDKAVVVCATLASGLIVAVPVLLWKLFWAPFLLYWERHRQAEETEFQLISNRDVQAAEVAELRAKLTESELIIKELLGHKERLEKGISEIDAHLQSRGEQIERLQAIVDSRLKQAEIRERLGQFMTKGQELMGECSKENQPAPNDAANQWAGEVEYFLLGHLGAEYIPRFRSDAGLPISGTFIVSIEHRNLWAGIRVRLARLEQFLAEMQANPK